MNESLNFSIDHPGNLSEVKILSIDGKVLSSLDRDVYLNQNSIDLSHLSAGIYYLRLVQNNKAYALPFAKN